MSLPASEFQTEPAAYITAKLRDQLWSKQAEIAQAVAHHRHVAVQSAHDTGKSFLAARLMAWWIACHEPGAAFVVSTAPTFVQVRAILWRELRKAHARAGLPGKVNETEWKINGELVAFGRKPADYDPSAFQGIHAEYVLVLIDEACGVPKEIFDAAESLATSEGCRILAIGNPDDPQSHFASMCKPGSGWHVIRVDGLESPNFTVEGRALPESIRRCLLSPLWVEERRQAWGEDDPRFASKVRGVFPEDQAGGVVPWSWVIKCQRERELTPEQLLPVELGMDVGAGGDQTVLRERRGLRAGRVWRYLTQESTEATGYAMQAIKETGATAIKVDVIGWGWGVVGRLKELRSQGKHSAEVIAVNVGEESDRPEKFPKLRDQIWWEIGRELSQDGAWDLSELDETTTGQLIAPRWKPDSSGRVKVEPKLETRSRLGRSPDDADALLLAYFRSSKTATSEGVFAMYKQEAEQVNAASGTTTKVGS